MAAAPARHGVLGGARSWLKPREPDAQRADILEGAGRSLVTVRDPIGAAGADDPISEGVLVGTRLLALPLQFEEGRGPVDQEEQVGRARQRAERFHARPLPWAAHEPIGTVEPEHIGTAELAHALDN